MAPAAGAAARDEAAKAAAADAKAGRPPPPPKRPKLIRVTDKIAVMPLDAPEVSQLPKRIAPEVAAFAALKYGGTNVRRAESTQATSRKTTRIAPVFTRKGNSIV